jgi:hypothetical protein
MTDAYRCLAEDDGARFRRGSESDRWTAEDSDGIAIVSDAMSIAEAARLYCEDKGLVSPRQILARIVAAYSSHRLLAEFWEGFKACQRDPARRSNPYQHDEDVKAQAWDRGADVAMQYQQALAHFATTPAEADEAELGWLVRLLRTGRC